MLDDGLSVRLRARGVVGLTALGSGFLVALPLPIPDLLFLFPAQILMLFSIGLAMRTSWAVSLAGALLVSPVVGVYTALGALLIHVTAACLPLVGSLLIAPLSAMTILSLGELTISCSSQGTYGDWAVTAENSSMRLRATNRPGAAARPPRSPRCVPPVAPRCAIGRGPGRLRVG